MAEKNGWTLCTPPWVGEEIFDIPLADRSPKQDCGVHVDTYCQNQESMIYTRKQVRKWLKIRPAWLQMLASWLHPSDVAAHLRIGDYGDLGYVVVSQDSYRNTCLKHDLPWPDWISEEAPAKIGGLPDHLSFLPDFYRLMRAPVILRANSSFSWWAATLGEGRVFSPIIDGKEGGKEQFCEFVEGNWPKLANIDNITDMRLFHPDERYDYPLTPKSVVVDCGGYNGEFTDRIWDKYHSNVIVYEPHPDWGGKLAIKYSSNANVCVIEGAVGARKRTEMFRTKGDMTGMFAEGTEAWSAHVYPIEDIIEDGVDLLKLNIEGMEFEVLERMLELDIATKCRDIQVQFHPVVENAERRYAVIRRLLDRTHRITYDEPWVWQNWERR